MSEASHVLVRLRPGAASPAPSTGPQVVYALCSWDDRSDTVESIHASIEGAQAAHLEAVHPERGPRGGRRPPAPAVEWVESRTPGHWTPDPDGPSEWSGWYIDQHEVRP